jgi:hypothetical protein
MTELERLKEIRSTAANWIGSADVKAAALLAATGALLAAIAFASSGTEDPLERGIVVLFCLLAALSILASTMVVFPRVNRVALLREGGRMVDEKSKSSSYFGDLGEMEFTEFSATVEKTDDKAAIVESREQTYVVCKVASKKMWWMRVSVVLLVLSLLTVAAFTIVRGLSKPRTHATRDTTVTGIAV